MSSFSEEKSKEFLNAAEKGDLGLVQSLSVDREVNLNWQDGNGRTPFVFACAYGHVDVIRYMLDFHGNHPREPIDYNYGNRNGAAPFLVACCVGHEKVVEMLLEDGRIDVNRASQREETPLWCASYWGNLGVVKRLLASTREIDVLKKDNREKKTAAEIARERGAKAEKDEWDSEEQFQQKKTEFPLIATLIESYQEDPEGVKAQLRRAPATLMNQHPKNTAAQAQGMEEQMELLRVQMQQLKSHMEKHIPRASPMASAAKNWSNTEAASWLEKKGQSKLSTIAGEQDWDGMILFGLYSARNNPEAYERDCHKLGVTSGGLQVKLKGLLVDLFEGAP